MAYVDDFKLSNTAITWNGVSYYPVTDWTYSGSYNSGSQNTRAAVRFLMAATSSIDNNVIIAQYSAYTPNGTMYRGSGYYLMRRLNSEPGDLSETGTINQGTIVSTPDIDIRLWPWNTTNDHTVKEGHLIWPDRPYILRSVGTLASGASGTCMRFYIKDTDPSYRNTKPSVVATYTAPYKVVFDANGGSGYVDPVAKNSGGTVTLPTSSDFTRSNYNLVGFSTNSDAVSPDAGLTPGATYTVTGNVTLYAVWTLAQNYIDYYQNKPSGASGSITNMPAQQIKQPNESITLSNKVPVGSDLNPPYNFVSWNTSTDGLGTSFAPSATYSSNINLKLYAIWKNNYKDRLSGAPQIYRAIKQGSTYTKDDYGEYLVVSGKVKVYTITGFANSPQTLTFTASPALSIPAITPPWGAGTSGTDSRGDYTEYSFEYKSPSAILDPGIAYNLTLLFKDQYQTTYSGAATIPYTTVIPVAYITFSTSAAGKSAAFGTEAAASVSGADASDQNGGPGRLDVSMNAYFGRDVTFNGDVLGLPVDGTTIDYNASN